MTQVFVSGATGFLGSQLALALAGRGHLVHAFFRSDNKAKSLRASGIRLFKGDIEDPETVGAAMTGCRLAYHTAAFAGVWARRAGMISRPNIEGTRVVITAARNAGVARVVHTSTAGVLGPSDGGTIDENCPNSAFPITAYDRSKAEAERVVLDFVKDGMNIVIVNPTRVFGPGVVGPSNSIVRLMKLYRKGRWRILPANGEAIGNYAFIEDIIAGHIAAMDKGIAGERYILGGENLSYNDFFRILGNVAGRRRRLVRFPIPAMLGWARINVLAARVFGLGPSITPELVRKLSSNWRVSSAKAINEIGYRITPFAEAAATTLAWLDGAANREP